MEFILNATTLTKGGSLQVATALILESVADSANINWHFAISNSVAEEVSRFIDLPPTATIFQKSPARDMTTRQQLTQLALRHPSAVVFTVLGPAYVRFPIPHLLGFADGWVTHPTWAAYRTLRFPKEMISFVATSLYKAFWLRRADHWCVETEVARQGLHRRVGIPLSKITVVPNTCGDHYRFKTSFQTARPQSGRLRLLCFAAPYPHKNLTLLPEIALHLRRHEPELDFEIVLTLPAECVLLRQIILHAQRLGVSEHFQNYGPVAVLDGPKLYRTCHICLLPTVLETYSASYAESMAMGLPIVTTDLNFAHDACGDAALYFPARDAHLAALQIRRLIHDPILWQQLTARGKQIAEALPTPRKRYEMYVALLQKLHQSLR